ncbi:MAG: Fe-S cluster assembly protein SufD, partial [Chloroflexota bacterium]
MPERVVVSRSRRADTPATRDFTFTPEQVRGLSSAAPLVRDYRAQAWEIFESLPLPTTNDEPWRRTDIRTLRAAALRLPDPALAAGLRNVQPPDALLQPLAGEAHGGQIMITAAGVQVELDPALARQGVIFTDLATAEAQHPELLARVLGQVVRADEGKFAALAGALAQSGVFVYVPRGVQVEKPLHSIVWGSGIDLAFIDHVLVLVDEG